MTPATIIREARATGVSLILSPSGTIKATGGRAAVNRWLPVIRARKGEIVEALKSAQGTPWHDRCPGQKSEAAFTPPAIRRPLEPLTPRQEADIRAWLALIEEADPATIAEVVGQCQREADARDYFLGMAAAALPPDDRHACTECANLSGLGVCLAARRGEIDAHRNYKPVKTILRRCEAFREMHDNCLHCQP